MYSNFLENVAAFFLIEKRLSFDMFSIAATQYNICCFVQPEFAQNGKEEITLAQLMRHEAGKCMRVPWM